MTYLLDLTFVATLGLTLALVAVVAARLIGGAL